jgi:hypothetical protein
LLAGLTKGEKLWRCTKLILLISSLRRAFAVAAGVLALPVMLFWKDRARFYSWLHRVWAKTSEQPVWMAQAEKASADFY